MNGFMDFLGQFGRRMPTTVPDQREPAQKSVPKRRWQDTAYMIGAGLKEMSGQQGALQQAQEMFAGREQQARLEEIRAGLPPEQQVLFDLSPEAWIKAYGMPQETPAMQTVNRGNGAYDVVDPRTGEVVRSQNPFETAPKAPERIEGPDGIYERGPDGQWKKVATFGAAPRIFAPPRKSGGGSGGGAKLPPGFILDGQ